MKTYWNHEGKYQEWVNKIEETTPSMYDTDNKYMNVFLIKLSLFNNDICCLLCQFIRNHVIFSCKV